jgi:hypothetical protein
MAKPIATFIVSACVGLGVIGCGPPAPPGQVNAVLSRDLPIYREEPEVCDKADTVVLAQCVQRQEYAKTVRGDWERHWYLTSWRVVGVERGRWPDASVDFIFYESWPTPESGIVLDLRAGPPVYHRGALTAFCVDTSQRKPVVVAQEERSHIPPHGRPRRPARDFYIRRQESRIYQQIIAAVDQFFENNHHRWGMREVVEEYDGFYVVEVSNALGSEAVTVEKGSYQVRPVEPAYK